MKPTLYTSVAATLSLAVLMAGQSHKAGAQGTIVRSPDGTSGVYVSGHGTGFAGTVGRNGFQGVAVAPDGKVQKIDSRSGINPFGGTVTTGRIASGNGVAVGAVAGNPAAANLPFDPFQFVFGQKMPGLVGGGIVAGGNGIAILNTMPEEYELAVREFRGGQYLRSLRIVEQLQRVWPDDTDIAQLHGLVLFAQGEYARAASDVYLALSSESSWDWSHVRTMYPDDQTYLGQFARLQERAIQVPDSAPVQMVLAYHALLLKRTDVARVALENAQRQLPHDALVRKLLRTLPPVIDGQPGR